MEPMVYLTLAIFSGVASMVMLGILADMENKR